MKAMVVKEAGMPFVPEELQIPEPGPGQVRIKVHACGVCHSDRFVAEALWPDLQLPRVPGHEVVGVVDAVGKAGADSTDTMAFAQLHGVKLRNEIFPLAEANAAYARMMEGTVRFRAVLDVAGA